MHRLFRSRARPVWWRRGPKRMLAAWSRETTGGRTGRHRAPAAPSDPEKGCPDVHDPAFSQSDPQLRRGARGGPSRSGGGQGGGPGPSFGADRGSSREDSSGYTTVEANRVLAAHQAWLSGDRGSMPEERVLAVAAASPAWDATSGSASVEASRVATTSHGVLTDDAPWDSSSGYGALETSRAAAGLFPRSRPPAMCAGPPGEPVTMLCQRWRPRPWPGTRPVAMARWK